MFSRMEESLGGLLSSARETRMGVGCVLVLWESRVGDSVILCSVNCVAVGGLCVGSHSCETDIGNVVGCFALCVHS
jgi:hypothetical protein